MTLQMVSIASYNCVNVLQKPYGMKRAIKKEETDTKGCQVKTFC